MNERALYKLLKEYWWLGAISSVWQAGQADVTAQTANAKDFPLELRKLYFLSIDGPAKGLWSRASREEIWVHVSSKNQRVRDGGKERVYRARELSSSSSILAGLFGGEVDEVYEQVAHLAIVYQRGWNNQVRLFRPPDGWHCLYAFLSGGYARTVLSK